MKSSVLLSLCALLLVSFSAHAELAPPRLFSVYPAGASAGSEVSVEVTGQITEEPSTLVFSHPGISATFVPYEPPKDLPKDKKPPDPPKYHSFKIKVAKDVPPGDYDVRFVGKFGISNPRMFVVSDNPESAETEPNNEKDKANKIALNSVVNARVGGGEDVDWFVFPAKAGQRVIIECRAWRIDSRLDGFMWLYDSAGKQLAMSQDEDIRDEKRDPFIDFDVPADGDYFIKLTDFTYNGSPEYFYRLTVGTQPYIDYIFPPGAAPGSTANIAVFGRNLPGGEGTDLKVNGRPLQKIMKQLQLPSEPEQFTELRFNGLVRPWGAILDGMEVRVKSDAGTSNARLLRYTSLPPVLEAEPNNEIAKAQKITVPCVVSGQLLREDSDFFSFTAKKDEKFVINMISNRLGAPADPELEMLKADGSVVNDAKDIGENIGQLRFTSNGRDCYHNFTAPADGEYTIRLEHLFRQAQGGPHYVYQLEVRKELEPDFRLVCSPPDEIKVDSHVVCQGGRERLDILVFRMFGHNEPITVEAKNLPPGVTADPIVIGKDVKWGTLVVTAAPDAAPVHAEFQVIGTSEINGRKLVRKARGGTMVWDTVNTPALARVARSTMLAIRETAPFLLTASPAEITVTKGQSFDLTMSLKRSPDMPNAVQLNGAGYQLPPNMSIPVKSIDPGQTETKLTINTDKMPEGTFSFLVNGDGQVPVGKDKKNKRCVYPSNTVKVTVQPKPAEPKK